MSIPYNENLSLSNYQSNPDWHQKVAAPALKEENQKERAVGELWLQTKDFPRRVVQVVRDSLRLILKVPVRALLTPVCLNKNWQERERATINAKLTGYAFVQLIAVPVKFLVALTVLGLSQERAKTLLDKSKEFTAHVDGRCSQLEALKEQGAKSCKSIEEFNDYRDWLYSINPKLCSK